MAWSSDVHKGYTGKTLSYWNLQSLQTDFEDSKAPRPGRPAVDPSHLRGRGRHGWMKILEGIYTVLMSNTLFRFSPKPSRANRYWVFLLNDNRWYVLNTLELCLQGDLHSFFVPMEETMAQQQSVKGEVEPHMGQITPWMGGRWALMGRWTKPAHPKVTLCTAYRACKVLQKRNSSLILNDVTFL